jgi:hypothetical protein
MHSNNAYLNEKNSLAGWHTRAYDALQTRFFHLLSDRRHTWPTPLFNGMTLSS